MKKIIITWPVHEEHKNLEKYLNDRESKNSKPISHNVDLKSLPALYNSIEKILTEMNVPYEKEYGNRFKRLEPVKDAIRLCYHSYGSNNAMRKDVWHVHTTGFAGYFHIDKRGYSAFSEPAHNIKFYDESKSVDLSIAKKFFDDFSKSYIDNGITRMYQPEEDLNLEEPFVFLAGQLSMDSVILHASNVNPLSYYNEIIKSCKYKVLFKPHPNNLMPKNPPIWPSKKLKFEVYNGSIHKAIEKAKAVFVVNSGVGLEALLHKKKVYTAGSCDYKWVTHHIESLDQIQEKMNLIDEEIDEESLIKYVYYLINHVYVNCYSEESIKKKLEHIIEINN